MARRRLSLWLLQNARRIRVRQEKWPAKAVSEAWKRADDKCECCGKRLSWKNRGRKSGPGSWEPHHAGPDRTTPMILCTEKPEDCHRRCGHEGDYRKRGIAPRVHRA